MLTLISPSIQIRVTGPFSPALCALFTFLAGSQLASAADSDLVLRHFREVDTLFTNPGQGWMSQQRSPRGAPRFPCSVINDNFGRVPPEAMPQLEKLARLAGARFVLRELSHPKTVKPGTPLNLWMQWANVGVGKLHRPYVLRLLLLNMEGRAVVTADAKADPREWLPGEHRVVESVRLPASLETGEYTLAVALEDPARRSRSFRLAMDLPEKAGRYEVSRFRVEKGL